MINLNQLIVLFLLCILIFGDFPKIINNFKSFLTKLNVRKKKKNRKKGT